MSLQVRLQFLQHGIFAHIVDPEDVRSLCGQDAQSFVEPLPSTVQRAEEPIPCSRCQTVFNDRVLVNVAQSDAGIATGEIARGVVDVFAAPPPPMFIETVTTIPPVYGAPYSDADRLRNWMGALGLSDTEAAAALNLGNPGVAIREYKRGKAIGGPALRLMAVTTALVVAIADLRKGQPGKAREGLERLLTPALADAVDKIAPHVGGG